MQRFRQSFCATRKQPFLLTKRKIWFAFINAHASAHHLFSTTPVTMRFAQWFRLSPRCGYHQPTIQSFQNKCNIITVALVYIYYIAGIGVVYARYTLMTPQPQNGENRQRWSFQSEVKDLPKLLGTWLRTDAARLWTKHWTLYQRW